MALTAEHLAEQECDEEELEMEYNDMCDEVVNLQAELRACKIETQQMRLRLQALKHKQSGPAVMPAPGTLLLEDRRVQELGRVFAWLAEQIAFERLEILDVGFEVPLCGRTVQMFRVAQWRLPSAFGGQLRLSVPIEHHVEMAAMLNSAKMHGAVPPNTLRSFASTWDLVAGDMLVPTSVLAEPSLLFANRGSSQGILVARWPTQEVLQAYYALQEAGGQALRIGDRIELDFEGHWYTGIIQAIDGTGMASVKCDVDAPGVFTVTPLERLRRLAPAEASGGQPVLKESSGTSATEAAGSCTAAGWNIEPKRPPVPSHRRTRSSAL